MKVVVTGAGGRTGGLIVQRLLNRVEDYALQAVVRSKASMDKLANNGVADAAISIVDVAAPGAEEALERPFSGAEALIIATSAVPKLVKLSLLKVLWKKLLRQEGARPDFTWSNDQMPEQVDYQGQLAQIRAAQKAGIKKVVLISSAGGTDESNALNALGNGKILVWKRKAEEFLIASGLTYTIIHPGGLIDEQGGLRELVLGVDDKLLEKATNEGTSRSIPRDDVAALAIACLATPSASDNRSVDVIAKKPEDAPPTTDFEALFEGLQGNCKY